VPAAAAAAAAAAAGAAAGAGMTYTRGASLTPSGATATTSRHSTTTEWSPLQSSLHSLIPTVSISQSHALTISGVVAGRQGDICPRPINFSLSENFRPKIPHLGLEIQHFEMNFGAKSKF